MRNLLAILILLLGCWPRNAQARIHRETVVSRHNMLLTETQPHSPSQVGNGEFAFGVDITGLQTFVPFNTLSQWGWHSFPLPKGVDTADFRGEIWDTHGRPVRYEIGNTDQPQLSEWLAANPHRINLGRIAFMLRKQNGTEVTETDLKNCRQEVDLFRGIITSHFEIEGVPVDVETACHPYRDMVAVRIQSPLAKRQQLAVRFSFPYAHPGQFADYMGNWDAPEAHTTTVDRLTPQRADLSRTLDDTRYHVSIHWNTKASLVTHATHQLDLIPQEETLNFVCAFSPQPIDTKLPTAVQSFATSERGWRKFWESGAAIDLSQSTDPRWKELERRIVLSQYLMRVNEAGTLPPQESGLVNNGWSGRFHFEMIWWHLAHYALWDRWPLAERSMHLYPDFLPTSRQRAQRQGYAGSRWPKCTAHFDREWPHPIHATLIWQQPHPIYFAELDYRLHPTRETLLKWRDVVIETADFMADYAYFDPQRGEYVLGPPIYIVSENTDPKTTTNPAFELGYWRFGLRIAQEWLNRLALPENKKWADVASRLSPLPQNNGLYETHEGIQQMWTKYTFEHPALIGVLGMLPGDGVDTVTFNRTLDKVLETWDFNRTWGWDFPMMAMAAARTGRPETAIDLLLHDSPGFQFDVHGLATGGPYPYFPSNGGLLMAVAMMTGGWDGSQSQTPGFPKNGKWVVRAEGFQKMP